MNVSDVVLKALSIICGVVGAVAPIYGAYDLWGRGGIPEKRVELTKLAAIDALQDLSQLGDRPRFTVQIDDRTIDNLMIVPMMLRNAGKAPIVPSDFTQPLAVSVKPPWRIVFVISSKNDVTNDALLRWKRVNEIKYEAEPALLNPSDSTWNYVYLTNSEPSRPANWATFAKPEIDVTARVINLRSFSEPEKAHEWPSSSNWGLRVNLSGWSWIFTVVAIPLFLALYLKLLVRTGLVRDWSGRSLLLVVGANLLSVSAAVSIATYAFPSRYSSLLAVNHWLVAPPILVHLGFLIWLTARLRAVGGSGQQVAAAERDAGR